MTWQTPTPQITPYNTNKTIINGCQLQLTFFIWFLATIVSILERGEQYSPNFPLSCGHRVIGITYEHFIHAGPYPRDRSFYLSKWEGDIAVYLESPLCKQQQQVALVGMQ